MGELVWCGGVGGEWWSARTGPKGGPPASMPDRPGQRPVLMKVPFFLPRHMALSSGSDACGQMAQHAQQ